MAPDRTTGRDPPQRREARFAKRRCSLHPGVFLPGCKERRSRRDKGGATVPVAANPGFCVRDGSPPGRRQLRWLRSRQPAPPGGRRERHKQENNKTDNNQGSSNQSQSRRKKRIITGKVMSFLTTGHKQRRRGKRTGAAGARSFPFPEGSGLPGSLVVHAATMSARRKGPPANQQPLYKGASVQSDQHQP